MRGSGGGGPSGDGPQDGPVTLRTGNHRDAAAAATLHAELIAEGFLSSLGPRFLRRLYGRIARSDGSFLVMAESQSTPVGFIAGSVAVGRLYRSFLVRDGVAASLSAPVRLVTALPRVLETLRHGGDGGEVGGELLAVAVDPSWRGRHVGRRLVEAFFDEIEQRGLGAAHVVVAADNAAAIAMYGRSGFAPARTLEMHRGTTSLLMRTAIPSAAARSLPPEP
jgi:ribosomal protein S18 acetylase RimI-like enzyme